MSANQVLQCAPCVAFHELLSELFVLRANGVQQRRHLCLQFRPETVEAVEIEQQMEIRHCLVRRE